MEWGIRWGVEVGGGKIGVNLMKAETYLINRLGKGIIINIEQININKYRMKSSEPCSESVLERRPGLEKQLCEDQGQAWSYTARNHQFSLQIAGFNLAVRTISCLNNNLTLVAQYFYPNGKSLVLPSAYAEIFSAIANENAQNFHFFTQQDGKQLLLKCSLSSQPGLSTMDNIYQCLKYVQKSFPSFERALQALNLKSKNNRFSYKMLEQKLLLKKNIITAMNPSSAATQTQLFDSNQAQNSSVIRVKQVVEKKPEVFADQQPFSKKGGYFSVQRKNSIIHQFSGIQNQKQLAWKSPINLAQHRSVLESKMKKQIEYVSRIVDSKYLLTYYVSEAQPELIFMNYVPSLLKDYIYHEKAPFSQLLNFAKQLIQAVAVLHKSGVVHRDLKPENILIQGQSLKIIDYAESAMVDQTFDSQNFLGYTLPYSPFECSLGREEGFNRRQIDLWSVSIILYEMAFKSIPLFYTRWIGADILDMWRSTNDFSIFPLYRKRKGIPGIEEIISLISIRGIQMNPKQRISLLTYHRLISHLQEFYGSFKG